jgi:hypothetical protein
VAIGDTVAACEETYVKMLKSSGDGTTGEETGEITGKIQRIGQGVIDGNTHYYVVLENSDLIFDVPLVDFLEMVKYQEGDQVTFGYIQGETTCTVVSME